MMRPYFRPVLCWCLILLLPACSTVPVEPSAVYAKASRLHLYQLLQWSFDGRVAVSGSGDPWSAAIAWGHDPEQEQIKLSGPLGQGAVVVRLADGQVTIDRGGGDVQTSTQPETFINQRLGLSVPVSSLRYWVVGLPEPAQAAVEIGNGFKQSGWLVEYNQWQIVAGQSMPRKITVMNGPIKLKLIIDQWSLL